MKKTLLITLALSTAVFAEDTYVTIPGEGWTLKLDTPAITSSKTEMMNRRGSYIGSSTATGVTFSVSTELDAGGSNKECFDAYWTKAQTNPMLVKDTINTSNDKTAYYATHHSEGEYKGNHFETANGHAYFAKNGLCIDLHVSHWPLGEKSDELVANVLKSIQIIE